MSGLINLHYWSLVIQKRSLNGSLNLYSMIRGIVPNTFIKKKMIRASIAPYFIIETGLRMVRLLTPIYTWRKYATVIKLLSKNLVMRFLLKPTIFFLPYSTTENTILSHLLIYRVNGISGMMHSPTTNRVLKSAQQDFVREYSFFTISLGNVNMKD